MELKNSKMDKKIEQFENDIFDLMFDDKSNNKDLISFLERYSSDMRDRDGRTILINFIIENKNEFALYLINNKADLSIQDNEGLSALHFAVQEKNIEIIKSILLKLDKNQIDIQDKYGNTPLWKAIKTDETSVKIIDLLIIKGADIKKKNKKGISPLDKMMNNSDVFKKYLN